MRIITQRKKKKMPQTNSKERTEMEKVLGQRDGGMARAGMLCVINMIHDEHILRNADEEIGQSLKYFLK